LKRWVKVVVYVALWIAALAATDPDPRSIALAHLFPLGLYAFFDYQGANAGGWGIFFGTYAAYAVHAICYFRAKTRGSFFALLVVLIALLIMNVAGCHAMNANRH
jgi:hypothetical protein